MDDCKYPELRADRKLEIDGKIFAEFLFAQPELRLLRG